MAQSNDKYFNQKCPTNRNPTHSQKAPFDTQRVTTLAPSSFAAKRLEIHFCRETWAKGTKELYQQSEQWQDFSEIEEFEPQGVELVTPTQPQATVIYDLSGQQLSTDLQQLPDGIYIVNGEKVIKQTDHNL